MKHLFAFLTLLATTFMFVAPSHATSNPSEKVLAVQWIVGFITKHAPPGRKTYNRAAQETKPEALKRYDSIANDLVEVVYSATNPPIFGGSHGRARTATVMLGIMLYESGFGKHVDYNLGKYARGDNGGSWCLMQMNVGKGRAWANAGGWNVKHNRPWRFGDKTHDITKGASGPEMIADRRKCFTEALRLIPRRSCLFMQLGAVVESQLLFEVAG